MANIPKYLNIKENHQLLEFTDATANLNNNLQLLKIIGLVTGDNGTFGFFVWNKNNDLIEIESIFPIDSNFKFELNTNKNNILLKITYGRYMYNSKKFPDLLIDFDEPEKKILQKKEEYSAVKFSNQFTLNFNEFTDKFISLLYELVSINHDIYNPLIDYDWIKQYPEKCYQFEALENATTNGDFSQNDTSKKNLLIDIDSGNNSINDKTKLDFLPVDSSLETKNKNDFKQEFIMNQFYFDDSSDYKFPESNREYQIQLATEERSCEYASYKDYSLFIGTWNVNGQMMMYPTLLSNFAYPILTPPAFYVFGFQELDLNKEAFIFNDTKREDYWICVCQQAINRGQKCVLLKKIRLIGMMILIFVTVDALPFIENVVGASVGTGLLGKLGNKGAVAVRLDFYDTSICFVNCHLAAHVDQFEKRNLDYREINSRLLFESVLFNEPKRICDHDQIYWFGDLNYRLNISGDSAKFLIEDKRLDVLLKNYDQLYCQMNLKNCFHGYSEGEINYLPTYKYNPGTNEWDSSEKERPPAWCDRILWRGERIVQIEYISHPDIKDSDHKPVSAIFSSKALKVDQILKRKVSEDVMKKLDQLENAKLPQIVIDKNEINFGTVFFKDNASRSLTLTNIGRDRIHYRFKNKNNDPTFCKSWLRVTPSSGVIPVNEQINITFEINFANPSNAYKFNYGIDKISDTLILMLVGGKHIFLTITGEYQPSTFGCSLETLIHLHRPISSYSIKEFQENFELKFKSLNHEFCLHDDLNTDKAKSLQIPLPVPKELFALIDTLIKEPKIDINVFENIGLEHELIAIRKALDNDEKNQLETVSKNSIAEVLLLFLETLAEPVIPYQFYNRVLSAKDNYVACKEIYSDLPKVHQNVFKYLMTFLQELDERTEIHSVNKRYTAKLFASILIRNPADWELSELYSDIKAELFEEKTTLRCTSDELLTPGQMFINFFLNFKQW